MVNPVAIRPARKLGGGFVGILACAAIGPAQAGSGFLLRSQSATTIGTAQAGMATNVEDRTSMVFNPSLLTCTRGTELDLSVTPIIPSGQFDQGSATTILGTPITGGNGGSAGKNGFPLNLFLATDLGGGFSAGLALTSLFGLGFGYQEGWFGRYHAWKSELLTIDIIPSLAYRAGPLSVGIGIDARYARTDTKTAIDFGTIAFAASGGAFGVPSANDGALRTRLDDWGVGVLVGVTFDPDETGRTRIGIGYRSRVKTTLTGKATFDTGGPVGDTVAALTGQFANTRASAPLAFPAAAIVGLDQQVSTHLRILGDVQWTQWSSLQRLELSFANPLAQPVVTDLRWRDSWFVAAGLRYEAEGGWVLRTGIAYDQTPTRHETSTPAIPDADAVWLTFGAGYAFDKSTKLDFGYGHIFVKNNPIALQASAPGNAVSGSLQGTIRGSVNFVNLQLSRRF